MPIVFPAPPGTPTDDTLLGTNAEFFEINRELTRIYITENPTDLVLIPAVETKLATGGFRRTLGTPRASQTGRLIEFSTVVGYGGQRVSDGHVHNHRWILLLSYDAVAALHDTFIQDGKTWEIVDFEPKNGYEVRAVVDRYGA